MSLYKKWKTDRQLEVDGTLVKYEEVEFVLARAGGANSDYLKAMEALRDELGEGMSDMSDDDLRPFFADLFAKHIVKAMRNATDEDDQPLEDTPENRAKVLVDLPELFDDLRFVSAKKETYLQHVLEAQAKN